MEVLAANSFTAIINQHRTGIVSYLMLMEILMMRSEHLWICFTCSEDVLMSN